MGKQYMKKASSEQPRYYIIIKPYLEVAKPDFRVDNGKRQDMVDEWLSLSCSGRYAKDLHDDKG